MDGQMDGWVDEEAGNSLIASLHNLSGLLSVTKVLLLVGWCGGGAS